MRTLTDYEYPVLAMDAYNRGQDPPTSTGPTISNVGREMNQGDLPRGPMLVLRQNLPAVTLRPRCRRSVREPAAFASGAEGSRSVPGLGNLQDPASLQKRAPTGGTWRPGGDPAKGRPAVRQVSSVRS